MMKITSNYIEQPIFERLQEIMIGPFFPWYYNNSILLGQEEDKRAFQFTHTFVRDGEVTSDFFTILGPLLEKINPKEVFRVKANLGPIMNYPRVGGFHIDLEDTLVTTAVFYINKNNGYTLFENGEKVLSVPNTLVEFDSNIKHTGVSQTDTQVRCLINLNYVK